MAEEIERIYIIPLKKTGFKSSKAAPVAVKRVKSYLTKHMKVEEENIWIDDSLNNALWSHGKYNIPSKIRVKAVKFEDGVVEAYLPELEFKKSRRELLKEEKEKKEPILKKEEEVGEEAVAGAEDYDIAPAADGEVKIKKKKATKEKEETKEKVSKDKPKKKEKKVDKKIKTVKKPAEKKEGKKIKKKVTAKKTTKTKKPQKKETPKKDKKEK
ncbi:MAG: 50S ribosomal protein L31e [Thermoplasmatales archaeon]|nr:MAG: 50S ribosomal protein L31e [Thermoplasmatales archaeon]